MIDERRTGYGRKATQEHRKITLDIPIYVPTERFLVAIIAYSKVACYQSPGGLLSTIGEQKLEVIQLATSSAQVPII